MCFWAFCTAGCDRLSPPGSVHGNGGGDRHKAETGGPTPSDRIAFQTFVCWVRGRCKRKQSGADNCPTEPRRRPKTATPVVKVMYYKLTSTLEQNNTCYICFFRPLACTGVAGWVGRIRDTTSLSAAPEANKKPPFLAPVPVLCRTVCDVSSISLSCVGRLEQPAHPQTTLTQRLASSRISYTPPSPPDPAKKEQFSSNSFE